MLEKFCFFGLKTRLSFTGVPAGDYIEFFFAAQGPDPVSCKLARQNQPQRQVSELNGQLLFAAFHHREKKNICVQCEEKISKMLSGSL